MAKQKFDGVVEAVHYAPDGQVKWVRAYLRRGSVFSDRVLVDRSALMEQIRNGKIFVVGRRIPQMGAVFEVDREIKLLSKNGDEFLTMGDLQGEKDRLEGVPVL